jgi:hypothetical protein
MVDYPKYYRKVIKGVVGGEYLNIRKQDDEFLLKGDPATADPESITIELYDAEAEKYFLRHNKPAIMHGYLIEVTDGKQTLESVNAVGDGYLNDLLKLPLKEMKEKVDQFTSQVPVSRLLELAIKSNKPHNTVEYLNKVLSTFDTNIKLDAATFTR